MVQAGKRVGRAGDRCKRLLIGSLPLIDHKESCRYKSKLVKFLDKPNDQPSLKELRNKKIAGVNFNSL